MLVRVNMLWISRLMLSLSQSWSIMFMHLYSWHCHIIAPDARLCFVSSSQKDCISHPTHRLQQLIIWCDLYQILCTEFYHYLTPYSMSAKFVMALWAVAYSCIVCCLMRLLHLVEGIKWVEISAQNECHEQHACVTLQTSWIIMHGFQAIFLIMIDELCLEYLTLLIYSTTAKHQHLR